MTRYKQAKLETVRPTRKLGPMKRRLFSRKLRCGHCGAALIRHEIAQGVYYTCDGRAWNGTDDCKKIRLFETDLIQAVLASIRFQAQLAKRTEEPLDRQAKKSKRRKIVLSQPNSVSKGESLSWRRRKRKPI